MQRSFETQFASLVEKYAELLTGSSSPDIVNKVKIWALYQHINKTMPAITAHWNSAHPDVKPVMRALFEEIKSLNAAHRSANQTDNPQE